MEVRWTLDRATLGGAGSEERRVGGTVTLHPLTAGHGRRGRRPGATFRRTDQCVGSFYVDSHPGVDRIRSLNL